ncbi:MAG: AMP-binding protein [Aquabacterium sp.]
MRIDSLFWRSVRLFPATPAVIDASRTLTYAELGQEVTRMTGLLLACGVKTGDRVAMLAKNRWEYVALFYAAASIDAVVVPLNWRLSLPELRWILDDAAPSVVMASAPYAQQLDGVRHELASVRDWFALDECPEGWAALSSVLPAVPSANRVFEPEHSTSRSQAEFVQIYTSGTTGRPKGAVLTHANMAAAVMAIAPDFALKPGQDKYLQVTPLFHVGGLLSVMLCGTTSVTLRLLPEFEPAAAARCLADEGVSHTLMVPAMLRWMLSEPGIDALCFPQLRLVAYGAAPMPIPVLEQASERLRCSFLQGYGLSETGGVLTILRPEDHVMDGSPAALARLGSAGREMLATQIRVVDPEGRDVPVGEPGEVIARGASISPGYWHLPEATREAHRNGWFWTGDIGWLDEQRYLTIVDRSKDMIVLGGENIYPREIELALLTHPVVADCAVIGIPHDTWGEEVLAYVSLQPGADLCPARADRALPPDPGALQVPDAAGAARCHPAQCGRQDRKAPAARALLEGAKTPSVSGPISTSPATRGDLST